MSHQFARWAGVLSIAGALLGGLSLVGCVEGEDGIGHVAPTPQGFDKYLVYMAAGAYDPEDPSFTPPSGEFFQKVIMRRTDAEIARERADALAFFKRRFGVDPEAPGSGVEFGSFMLDPRNEYRAYTVSGRSAPSEGWVVRDGGYRLEIVADDGVTLGGEFAGVHVPRGTVMVFGDYNIATTVGDRHVHDPRAIVIHYESAHPIVRNEDGSLMFLCDLTHPVWGEGVAQGISAPQSLGELRQANIRNVLTFPKYGPSIIHR